MCGIGDEIFNCYNTIFRLIDLVILLMSSEIPTYVQIVIFVEHTPFVLSLSFYSFLFQLQETAAQLTTERKKVCLFCCGVQIITFLSSFCSVEKKCQRV